MSILNFTFVMMSVKEKMPQPVDKMATDQELLEELTRQYLRGEIEIEEYKEKTSELDTQLSFRKLASEIRRRNFSFMGFG